MVLSESRRWWDGGRNEPVEWTAEGGLKRSPLGAPQNREILWGVENETEPSGIFAVRRKWSGGVSFGGVCPDGLFPRYQGKARVGAPPSGRFLDRQFGWHRRSFKTFVPKVPVMGPIVDGGLFLTLRLRERPLSRKEQAS